MNIYIFWGLIAFIAACAMAFSAVSHTNNYLQKKILQDADLIAQSLTVEHIKALLSETSNVDKLQYNRLKEQLKGSLALYPEYDSLCILGRGEKDIPRKLVCAGLSVDDNVKYCEIKDGQVFRSGKEYIRESHDDKVYAYAPIYDQGQTVYSLMLATQTKALVEKAVEFKKIHGRERLLQEIAKPDGIFRRNDIYVFACDLNADFIAHPVKPELLKKQTFREHAFTRKAKDLINFVDSGWIEYEYENPVSKQIEPKATYVLKSDDMLLCAGIYKGQWAVIAALEVSIDRKKWDQQKYSVIIPALLFTLTLFIIVIAGLSISRIKFLNKDFSKWWHTWGNVATVTLAGVVLTAFMVWITHHANILTRQDAFFQLASSQTWNVVDILQDIRNNEINGMARFFEASDDVDYEEFKHYAQSLTNNSAVAAWGWAPLTATKDLDNFEAQAATETGQKNYHIWQFDNAGKRTAPSADGLLCPVYYLAPDIDDVTLYGYDISSNTDLWQACDRSRRTLLPSASTLTDKTGSKNKKTIIIYHAVFDRKTPDKIKGFVFAILQLKALVEAVGHKDPNTLKISLIHEDGYLEPLATGITKGLPPVTKLSFTRPLNIFGKNFAITSEACENFLQLYPAWNQWLVGISGLILTFGLAFLLIIISMRRAELEHLVAERTYNLRKSEGFMYATLRSIGDGVIVCNKDGCVINLNGVAEEMTGWSNSMAAGLPVDEIFNIVDSRTRRKAVNPLKASLHSGEIVELSNHTALISRKGREYQIADSCAPIKDAGGEILGAVLVFRNVTEEYRQREELRESKRRFDQLAEQSRSIVWELNADGLYTYISEVVERVLGYTPEELIGKVYFYDLHPEEGREEFKKTAFDVFEKNQAFQNIVNPAITKTGETIWFTTNGIPMFDEHGKFIGYHGTDTDITESKQRSIYRKMGTEILNILNKPGDIQAAFKKIISVIKDFTHCEAVGIRMEQGEDFPYMVENGFSREFLLSENSLAAYDENGGICRDANGKVSLECTCGLVISGKTDPSNPLFTKGGSCWTNDSFPLLELPQEKDPRFHPRNECVHNGYSSIALIPIRNENRIVGLIHINYLQKGRLSLERVEQLEEIAAHIGSAMMRKQAEMKYETLFNKMLDGYVLHEIICDNKGAPIDYRFLAINPTYEAMTGLNASRVIGHTALEIIKDEKQRRIDVYGRVALSGKSETFEFYSETLKKHFFVKVFKTAMRQFACIFSDITERRKNEESLKRTQFVLDRAKDNCMWVDNTGRLIYVNDSSCQALGYSREELLNMTVFDIDPDFLPQKFEQHKKDLRSMGSMTFESRQIRKDGHIYPVEVSTNYFEINGHFVGCAFCRDISERKLAEEKLLESNRQLELANEMSKEMAKRAEEASHAKSEFLANMSHEIRTPMNGVIGMAGLLLDSKLDKQQRHFAEAICSSGESLLTIINDILDFSKIEAGKMELDKQDFDLNQLLDDITTILSVRAHEKGLELICAVDPDVPLLLHGDPVRLRQIITNLAGNAVKFTEKGEIEIHVSLITQADHEVSLRFSVRDTGIGIPEEKLRLLGVRFSQVDTSTSRRYGGTGLGLAISKHLSRMMGGELGVQSQEGEGSEFWFTVRIETQDTQQSIAALDATSLKDIRVMVVDDNATNRNIITANLQSWGMLPEEAEDGPSALEKMHQAANSDAPLHLILIDMHMPGMNGEALGRIIQSDPRLNKPKMLMLSSENHQDIQNLRNIGFHGFLMKPLRVHELHKAIISALTSDQETIVPPQRVIHESPGGKLTSADLSDTNARILLAEDNPVNQEVAMGILAKIGMRADIAENGIQALHMLTQHSYDLILMDCQMPELDGYQTCRHIRNPESTVLDHNVPVVAMTAHALDGAREACIEAGMNDYISKPISANSLSKVLKKWLKPQHADNETTTVGDHEEQISPRYGSKKYVWNKELMIKCLMDDKDFAARTVKIFLHNIPTQLEKLASELEHGESNDIVNILHDMKGAAAHMNADFMWMFICEMEKNAKASDIDKVKQALPELNKKFAQVKKEMESVKWQQIT
ncbi:MAG: PAS domain S-box protein [Victivallales bacterium]|nr:PAS domain S-box protein [Victivallales bacterium]